MGAGMFFGKFNPVYLAPGRSPGYDSYVVLKLKVPRNCGWVEVLEQMNSTRSFIFLVLAALVVLVLAACGASEYKGQDGVPPSGLKVTLEEYSEIWPFDAKGGTLECVDSGAAVFHHGGDSYALNQPAVEQNYTPVEKIRKRGRKLEREHYDLAVESGDMSPNIRSYEQFLDSFGTTAVYYKEFPKLVNKLRGDLGPMTDLALTLY